MVGLVVFPLGFIIIMTILDPNDSKNQKEKLNKMMSDYPAFKDVDFNDVLSKKMIDKYLHLPLTLKHNESTLNNLLAYLTFHYFGDFQHPFVNNYPFKTLKQIYKNKKEHLFVIEKITLLAENIERLNKNGFIYKFEDDDLLYEIMEDVANIQKKTDLFDGLLKTFSEKKKHYLEQVQIFNELTEKHSQFLKEEKYHISIFHEPTRNIHLPEHEIRAIFNKKIEIINQETEKLKTYNEKVIQDIQNKLKHK